MLCSLIGVLVTQLTWPGLVIGFIGLITLFVRAESRHLAAALGVSILAYLAFAFWLPEAVLAPAFLMPIPMLLALAVAEMIREVETLIPTGYLRYLHGVVFAGALALAVTLFVNKLPFIRELTGSGKLLRNAGRRGLMLSLKLSMFLTGRYSRLFPLKFLTIIRQLML